MANFTQADLDHINASRKFRNRIAEAIERQEQEAYGPRWFTLPYPPSTNALYATVRGRRVLSKDGRQYKKTAAEMAIAAGVRPLAGEVKLTIRIYRPLLRGDLSNRFKCLEDCLKGIAWTDDEQVAEIHAVRKLDKDNPRAEVLIEAIR